MYVNYYKHRFRSNAQIITWLRMSFLLILVPLEINENQEKFVHDRSYRISNTTNC